MEWRTIETAPRDGSEIIICLLGHAVSARWIEHEAGYIDRGWLTIESRESYLSEDAPTHWMPLPEPLKGA